MKQSLNILLFAFLLAFLPSCKKVEFVPVVYEWFPMDSKVPVFEFDNLYSDYVFMDMYFPNAKNGFISVYSNFFSFQQFFKTEDSCKTFFVVPGDISGKIEEMCFVSDSIMYLLSGGYDHYNEPISNTYKSIDGGLTWEKLIIPGSILVSGISANQNGNVFLISEKAEKLLMSKDGGVSWSEPFAVFDPPEDGHLGMQMQFIGVSQDTGFFNYRDYLFITTDGGSSWSHYLFNEEHGFEKYFFLDINRVYVHHDENFYKSIDGGQSFELICSFIKYFTWQIISETESYGSNNNSVFFKSDDELRTRAFMNFYRTEGDAWEESFPKSFVITGSREGYAICLSGRIYKLDLSGN